MDTNSRILCYDIRDLGKQLLPVRMLVVLDSVFNRIIRNRRLGRSTWSILMRSMCVRKPPEATQAARDYANSTFGKWKGKCEI